MILSTVIIEAMGFKRVTKEKNLSWIDWEKDGFKISSDVGINGGGFNYNGRPLNTIQQLQNNYLLKTGKIL